MNRMLRIGSLLPVLLVVLIFVHPASANADGFKLALGDTLPRFSVETVEGELWASGDKAPATVILVFDCESDICDRMLPIVERRVWQPLKDDGLRLIGIGRNHDADALRDIARRHALTFDLAPDPDAEFAAIFAEEGRGVPRVLITGPEGEIVYRHVGYTPGREAEIHHVARSVLTGRPTRIAQRPTATGGDSGPNRHTFSARTVIGEVPPDFEVEYWITEQPKDLEGKYVFTEFFATWCGPCVRVMPHLQEFSDEHKERLVIRSISDEEPTRVERFVQSRELTFPIATDTLQRTKNAVQVRGIPHGYIQNPEGVVVWQGNPMHFVVEPDLLERVLSGEYVMEP